MKLGNRGYTLLDLLAIAFVVAAVFVLGMRLLGDGSSRRIIRSEINRLVGLYDRIDSGAPIEISPCDGSIYTIKGLAFECSSPSPSQEHGRSINLYYYGAWSPQTTTMDKMIGIARWSSGDQEPAIIVY